jgi:hypothetical protein
VTGKRVLWAAILSLGAGAAAAAAVQTCPHRIVD